MALGDRVVDRLTGFTGIVTGTTQYLTGCNQSLVKPDALKEDGSMRDAHWFDDQRLEIVEVGAFTLDNGSTPGGPQHW